VDVVHGHSSHHCKGAEVYRGRLVLYGCGDLISDYEGISVSWQAGRQAGMQAGVAGGQGRA
jgi:poly-gamma-glutamate synthesis protein (capsule biosynthesis protein)